MMSDHEPWDDAWQSWQSDGHYNRYAEETITCYPNSAQPWYSLGNLYLTHGVTLPLVVTGLAQVLFPGRANGSLKCPERAGRRLGTYWPALRTTRNISGGGSQRRVLRPIPRSMPRSKPGHPARTNGPLNPALLEAVQGRIKALQRLTPPTRSHPGGLVTASAVDSIPTSVLPLPPIR